LPSDAARRAATQVLFELLDEGGVLIILEAGEIEEKREVLLFMCPIH
jgi:hypothetical protein